MASLEEIWDKKKGPFMEVVDGTMRRTEAGKTALREELAMYLEKEGEQDVEGRLNRIRGPWVRLNGK